MTIENILLKLQSENEFKKHKTLYLLDKPDSKFLNKVKRNITENEIYVFARGYENIKIGSHFEALIPKKNLDEFVKCNVYLKYIYINPNYNIEYLPDGYSGLCLLEFKNGIPYNLINKLSFFDKPSDSLNYDTLILTQNQVLNKILELKNELPPCL